MAKYKLIDENGRGVDMEAVKVRDGDVWIIYALSPADDRELDNLARQFGVRVVVMPEDVRRVWTGCAAEGAYELRHHADELDPLPEGVRSAICVFCDTTFTGTMISEARANHAKECKAFIQLGGVASANAAHVEHVASLREQTQVEDAMFRAATAPLPTAKGVPCVAVQTRPKAFEERLGPPTKDLALVIAARDLRRAGWRVVLVAATDGEHEYGHADGDITKIAASRIGEFERFVRKIYHRTALDSSPIVHREAAALLGLSPLPYPFAVTSDADKQG